MNGTETITAADADERIRLFEEKFEGWYGEGHLVLACHAAFPLVLSVDLLYQIWANFKSYTSKWDTSEVVPMLAVSDLLLSPLFRQTGSGVYEMEPATRNQLLAQLKSDGRLGEARIQELASFLYQYVLSLPDRPELKAFKEAQRWTALLTVDPMAATQGVLQSLAERVKSSQVNASIGVVNMIEDLMQDNGTFSETVASHLQPQDIQAATEAPAGMEFSKSLFLDGKPAPGATLLKVNMPAYLSARLNGIKQTVKSVVKIDAKIKSIRAFLIGIGDYQAKNLKLNGPAHDVVKMSDCLKTIYQCPVEQLLNEHAVKDAILSKLQELLRNSGKDDLLLFYFSGHASNKGEKHRLVLWDYPEYAFSVKNEDDYCITEREFRSVLDQYAANDPHMVLMLDTHSGSGGWINTENPKHIALMASHVEETVYELPEKGGIFTDALCEVLLQFQGQVSYRSLYHEVFKKLDALLLNELHKVQTPKFYLHEESWDNLFFSMQKEDKKAVMQPLLHAFGYEAIKGADGTMDVEKSLLYFLKNCSIEDEQKALHYLQLGNDIRATEKLIALSIGNKYETEREYNHMFVKNFNKPGCEISFLPIPGSDKESPADAIKNLRQIIQAHILIIGVDRLLLNQPLNHSALGKLLARGFAYNKEIVLMLEEDMNVDEAIQKEFGAFRSNIRTVRLQQGKSLIKQAIDGIAQRMIGLLENNTERIRAGFGNLWEVGASIKIYFMDGTAVQREKVKSTAIEWTKHANLQFTFTDKRENSDIRITFKGEGIWSYVGTDCMKIAKDKPTMCLSFLTTKEQQTKEEKGYILREFGNAIGLKQEHQNPNREIEWNKEAVYKEFMEAPNNWTKATVDQLLFATYAATSKPFDPKSIMMNPISSKHTLNGFSSTSNNDLSDMDKQFIALLYPRAPTPTDTTGSTGNELQHPTQEAERDFFVRWNVRLKEYGSSEGLQAFFQAYRELNYGGILKKELDILAMQYNEYVSQHMSMRLSDEDFAIGCNKVVDSLLNYIPKLL
jgi:serralysin